MMYINCSSSKAILPEENATINEEDEQFSYIQDQNAAPSFSLTNCDEIENIENELILKRCV